MVCINGNFKLKDTVTRCIIKDNLKSSLEICKDPSIGFLYILHYFL